MRRAARVIIIHDEKLLVMHRDKFGTKYDTLPGGGVDVGETPEQTAMREVHEETGVQVSDLRLLFVEHAGDMYGDQYIYLATYVSGEPKLSTGSQEHAINKLGKNLYEPGWLPLKDLPEAPFLSDELRQRILEGVASGWPEEVQEFTGKRNV